MWAPPPLVPHIPPSLSFSSPASLSLCLSAFLPLNSLCPVPLLLSPSACPSNSLPISPTVSVLPYTNTSLHFSTLPFTSLHFSDSLILSSPPHLILPHTHTHTHAHTHTQRLLHTHTHTLTHLILPQGLAVPRLHPALLPQLPHFLLNLIRYTV
jgi:hypothetical protein